MKTSYIRDFKHNYLVIHDDRVISDDYEIRMLGRNRIEGLLSCDMRMINGEGFLYYDISSKHVMKSVFSEEIIGFEMIRALFISLIGLCSRMEKYLLYDDGLILDPEYIYYDIESKEFSFLYYKSDQSGKPGVLFEFLTEHLDNDDFSAVEAVYQMYDMSKRSYYALDEILRWFQDEYLDEGKETAVEDKDKDKMLPILSKSSDENDSKNMEYSEWEDKLIMEQQGVSGKNKKGLLRKIWEFLFRKEDDNEQNDFFEEYYDEPASYGPDNDNGENNTVFIPWVENSEHKLYGLGKGNKTHIDLSSVPVTIGKMRGAADIILNDESVSRLHAKLMRTGSRFFLLDLNSTNGSFKNGVRLSPNEKVVIEPGDEIGFGKLKFIYR
ncbi:MAG: FHA domain-containing protein [Lachnospiraceae bacterium]|nr:FHA domain-containing protein [Lachnospiraceae bacterium]